MNPKVAIIILNWNGWRDTIECLASLQRLTYPNYQVIVVDNGSTDDSVERIKAWAKENLGEGHLVVEYTQGDTPAGGKEAREDTFGVVPPKVRMVLIHNEENLGFTGGNTVTIRYALHRKYPVDYDFLLNNDAILEPDCLTACAKAAQLSVTVVVGDIVKCLRDDYVFTGTPRSLLSDLLVLHAFIPYRHPSSLPTFWKVGCVQGCAMLLRQELLERLKGNDVYYLNPSYFMYGEEAEFCFRTREHGYKFVMMRNALVYHHYGNSAGFNNPLAPYYFTRNKMFLSNEVLPLYLIILFRLVETLWAESVAPIST